MKTDTIMIHMHRYNKVIIILLLISFLTACANSKQIPNNITDVKVEDIASDTSTSNGKDDSSNTKAVKEQIEVTADDTQFLKSFSAISEMFAELDTNYSLDYSLYMEAIRAYDEQIDAIKADEIREYYGNIGELRVSFGYVDEDIIPELFIAAETIHVFGVNVYTYDSSKKEVVWLGEFSSFGSMTYVEQKNRIVSSYGSNGFYMHMFSAIEQNKPVLVGSVAEYMNLAELYFARYPVPEGTDGSHKDAYGGLTDGTGPNAVEVDFPDIRDVTYIVSKDEYDQVVTVYENLPESGEVKTVSYDEMYNVNFK